MENRNQLDDEEIAWKQMEPEYCCPVCGEHHPGWVPVKINHHICRLCQCGDCSVIWLASIVHTFQELQWNDNCPEFWLQFLGWTLLESRLAKVDLQAIDDSPYTDETAERLLWKAQRWVRRRFTKYVD